MRTAIPSFTQLVSPLQRLFEAVYVAAAGTRTRTAVAKISLSQVGWDGSYTDAMQACKDAFLHSVTLAHPSPSKRLCIYTDASNEFWSEIATQVPPADLDCPRSDQHHEPLAFLSCSFTGSMRRWAIIEKRPMQSSLVVSASTGSFNGRRVFPVHRPPKPALCL
jgi:RNase H-like domain found in reverse transcriptase